MSLGNIKKYNQLHMQWTQRCALRRIARRYKALDMKLIVLFVSFMMVQISFAQDSKVEGDINCDGKSDMAFIEQDGKQVTLKVKLNDGSLTNELTFGLNDPNHQDSLCGTNAVLDAEQLADDLSEELGETPRWYKPSPECIGLNIRTGDCDSIHVFWNSEQKEINWWRL